MKQSISQQSSQKSSSTSTTPQLRSNRAFPIAPTTIATDTSRTNGHSFGQVSVFPGTAPKPTHRFVRQEIPLPSLIQTQDGQQTPQLQQLVGSLGSGQALSPSASSRLQQFSDVPLNDVRVHDDRTSHIAASTLNSEGFALGNHIVLGDPATRQTQRDWLLAHEVAHTIQQHPQKRGSTTSDREQEADRFADRAITRPASEQNQVSMLNPAPLGLARRVITRITQDLPGDLLLVLDVDDGDFVGGCVRAIVPHVGAKLIRKGVPKGAGNQIFNMHVGFVTNALGQSCVFFYESVSGLCEMKCFATMEELREAMDEILDWLVDLVKQVLEALLVAAVIIGLVVLAYLIAQALVAALLVLA